MIAWLIRKSWENCPDTHIQVINYHIIYQIIGYVVLIIAVGMALHWGLNKWADKIGRWMK